MTLQDCLPGNPYPLGAQIRDEGVNFAAFSRNGTRVILELFAKDSDGDPYASLDLDPVKNRTGDIWHIFVPLHIGDALNLPTDDVE